MRRRNARRKKVRLCLKGITKLNYSRYDEGEASSKSNRPKPDWLLTTVVLKNERREWLTSRNKQKKKTIFYNMKRNQTFAKVTWRLSTRRLMHLDRSMASSAFILFISAATFFILLVLLGVGCFLLHGFASDQIVVYKVSFELLRYRAMVT